MTMPPLLLTWFRPVGRRKFWGFSLLFQWIFTSFCVQKWQNKHQNSVFVCYKHRGDRKKSPAALKTGQKHQIWVILIRIWKLMTMPPLVIDNLGTRGGIVVINSTDEVPSSPGFGRILSISGLREGAVWHFSDGLATSGGIWHLRIVFGKIELQILLSLKNILSRLCEHQLKMITCRLFSVNSPLSYAIC